MTRIVLLRAIKPVGIVLILGFVALSLLRSRSDTVALPTPHWGWLAAAAVCFLLHYFIQAIGWHVLLRAIGEDVSPRLSLRMWYLSMIARWMPGRVWYSATRLYLAHEAGISLSGVTFGIVLELIYILMGGILATLLFAGSHLQGVMASSSGRSAFAAVIVLVCGCSLVILRPQMLLRLSQWRLFQKAVKRLTGKDLREQSPPQLSVRTSLLLLLFYTLFWIYSGVMFGVLARAFIPMTPERWMMCIPAFAGSWLIGFFSIITPAGLGAREGAMWLMLQPVMPQTHAVVLAVVSRLMMMGTELLSVAIATPLLKLPRESHPMPEPVETLSPVSG